MGYKALPRPSALASVRGIIGMEEGEQGHGGGGGWRVKAIAEARLHTARLHSKEHPPALGSATNPPRWLAQ